MPANVETMFYAKEVPWHGLGTRVEEAQTSKEALELAGLNWNVEAHDVYVKGESVPGYQANVRDSDGSVFGIVSTRYKIVQNSAAFGFTDFLLNNDQGVEVLYDTAGALEGGRRVWMLALMPERTVLGDKVRPYLVFTNSHDGKGSIKVAVTPIRVVCENTLTLALGSANRVWSTRHMGDIETKMEEASRTLQLAQEYLVDFEEQAEVYQQAKLSRNDIEEFLGQVFPYPKASLMTERQMNAVNQQRSAFLNIYEDKADLQQWKGTAWGVYNALSDFESHIKPRRESPSFRERRFGSIIDGSTEFRLFTGEKALKQLVAA